MAIPKHNSYLDASGTSLQGYIHISYDQLVELFGEPDLGADGYKIDREWMLKFDDGTIVTIYNWKNGPNYLGKDGIAPERITEWNVGGLTEKALHKLDACIELKELLLQ